MFTVKNNIHLIGKINEDPKINTTAEGKKIARLLLATSEHYKNKNGEAFITTQNHQLVAIGKLAETVEAQICKGNQIAISGKLINRKIKDALGNIKFITEIFTNDILLLNKKAIA